MATTRPVFADLIDSAATAGGLAVADPATGEVLTAVRNGSTNEALGAVDAAWAAAAEWRERPAQERAALLRTLAGLMLEKKEQLAQLLTAEQGKPLAEARGEIAYAASFIDWAAEEAKRVYGETVPASHRDKRILVLKQPVGIAAIITPWNFPSAMIARKLGPALAAGCTVVIKPANQTPLSAYALGKLALDAGIPPGVVNILTGNSRAIGDAWLSDPRVRKLSFTGSTEVGRVLMSKASQNLIRLSMELGGHAPFLVFDDADVSAAVRGAIMSKYRNAGQTCVCANRFYIQAGVYARFAAELSAAVAQMKVGRGTDEGVSIGPLIDDSAVAKVEAHIEDARAKGATVRQGGHRVKPGPGLTDRFFAPTILEGFDHTMLIAREETFGPVSPLKVFHHEDEAIELANDSEFGLAAYFYTRDASRLMRVAERLEYGIVGANDGAPSTAQAPFGGVKHSGFGREGGKYVMEEYLETKYVSWGLETPESRS
ncbi:MAG: NAD-dependent succinate-semialdehyde dehydrogenase [Bryobacteraceae bacterium]